MPTVVQFAPSSIFGATFICVLNTVYFLFANFVVCLTEILPYFKQQSHSAVFSLGTASFSAENTTSPTSLPRLPHLPRQDPEDVHGVVAGVRECGEELSVERGPVGQIPEGHGEVVEHYTTKLHITGDITHYTVHMETCGPDT